MFKIPENIDLEVVRLLEEADWPWDPWHRAFRQAARANEPFADYVKRMKQNPRLITYSELEDHGLASRKAGAVTPKQRAEGSAWLKKKIGQAPAGPPRRLS
jgi:hypothetical protein